MKRSILIMFLLGLCLNGFTQIVFNGCHPLIEDQEYVFNFIETDATGRNVFATTPVDGDQTCGGIGTCEFMIAWNDVNSKWEFIADDGNGDFSAPYLIYSNPSASLPNPPSLILGTWVENSATTEDNCGGDLSTSNAVLTGDVQDLELSLKDHWPENKVVIYPLPAAHLINIKTALPVKNVSIYDLRGLRIIDKLNDVKQVDITNLESGVYFLKIETNQQKIVRKITVK